MTVNGARISLAGRASASVIIAGFIGVIVGAIAGFAGGKVDNVLMRLVDVLFAIPFLFVILVAARFFGQGDVWSIILIFGLLDLAAHRAPRAGLVPDAARGRLRRRGASGRA